MPPRPSILYDRLPNSIVVGGKSYRIYTDFRRWILLTKLFEEAFGDEVHISGITVADCAAMLVCPAIRSVLKNDPSLADGFIREIGRFALMGKEIRDDSMNSRGTASGGAAPLYDFEIDGERIFASFMAVYGIDLTSVTMHWWKFMSLLRCLPRDCVFMQVVELRGLDVSRIEDDGLRRQLRRARAAVRIPRKTTNK